MAWINPIKPTAQQVKPFKIVKIVTAPDRTFTESIVNEYSNQTVANARCNYLNVNHRVVCTRYVVRDIRLTGGK